MDDGSIRTPEGEGLNPRLVRLEEWRTLAEARFDRIEDKLDQIIQRLAETPTRADLQGTLVAAFVAALAVMSLVIGGLGWLETRAARLQPALAAPPAPIVVQLPPYPQSARVKPTR